MMLIGGLVGQNQETATITSSYSTGNVNGMSTVGGLVGENQNVLIIISSYSTGNVTGDLNTGGFIGINGIGTITNCFWNSEVQTNDLNDTGNDNNLTTAEITGLTTSEMLDFQTYEDANWDFINTWGITDSSINNGYPYLLWQVP